MTQALFLDEFPPTNYETWRSGVEQELRGASFDKSLGHVLADGFAVQPLYCEENAPTAGDPASFPGGFPHTRGALLPRKGMGWAIGCEIADPDPQAARSALLADLELGAELIWLRVGGPAGLVWQDLGSVGVLLDGVEPQYLQLVLDAGEGALPAASLFLAWAKRQNRLRELRGSLGCDPLSTLAVHGRLPGSLAEAWAELAGLAGYCLKEAPELRAALVSTASWHRAGATPAYEIGLGLAAGLETLRAFESHGIAPEEGAGQILFAHELGSEIFLEIAKLRASRLVWSKVLAASGAGQVAAGQQHLALASSVAATCVDPWVNLLRSTAQGFAAAIGGADGLVLRPWDAPLGRPEASGRRFAITSQYVLAEESHLRKVADPAGGSWALEALTDQLARQAWKVAQDIEKEGGLGATLAAGTVQRRLGELAAARRKSFAQRKSQIVGTSVFPLLEEERPHRATPPAAVAPSGQGKSFATVDARVAAAGDGSGWSELAPSRRGEAAVVVPLGTFRPADDFENLRLAADLAALRGARPKIFFANLGQPADTRARAEFCAGLFPVAGLQIVDVGSREKVEELAAAFKESGCRVAVLNSTDELYGARGEAAAQALKAAGCERLCLAGRPGEREAALRTAGVDDFVYLGADVAELLSLLLRHLEVIP